MLVGAEYMYYPKKWIGAGGKIERDLLNNTTGIYIKTNVKFG